MPRRPPRALVLAGLVLALGACDAEKKPPSTGEVPPPVSPPAPASAPALAPAPPPPTLGKPFHRPGDRAAQVDALTFWGWSADGRRFAFETSYAGPGAATCEGELDLFVVDADSDTFVPGGHIEIRPEHPDREPCDPPDLQAAMDLQRPAVLAAHGIEVGHLTAPVEPTPAGHPRPAVSRHTITLPSGKAALAELEVLSGDRDQAPFGKGAAFKLGLAVGDEPPLVLEDGARRRPYVWNYDLGRGLAFFSPDGSHAAILTATVQISFEGDRTSYLASGLRLPQRW